MRRSHESIIAPHPATASLGAALALAALTSTTAPAQDGDREPFIAVPGILSLPNTNPWGLGQMLVKHAGFFTTQPGPASANPGTPDFSENVLLNGASGLDIDAFSVGLDWILADDSGRVPPPASASNPNSWTWAGFLFTPGHTTVDLGQHAAITVERARVDGAGADLFFYTLRGSVMPGTTAPIPNFDVRLMADSTEVSLYNGNPSDRTAIDAFDLFAFFYLNSEFEPYLPQPPRAFFSVSAATVMNIPPQWNIPVASQSGATIFQTVWQLGAWTTPTVYRTPASLGLAPTNDVDALAVDTLRLFDHGGQHYVLFSLDPNVGPNSAPGPGTGISFARSGAPGVRTAYLDHTGAAIDEQIGRGVNIRSICDLDPSRDALFPPNVGIGKAPPFLPWNGGSTRSVVWRDYMGCDMLRTFLLSDPCNFGQTPNHAALLLMEKNTLQTLGPVFVLATQRGGGIGSGAWRGCPATIDIFLPPGIDQFVVDLNFFWADINGTTLALTTPLPKGMRF